MLIEQLTLFKLKRWNRPEPPVREDLEAALRAEGLEPQHWVDPAGTYYPRHSHRCAELRWLIQGELHVGLPGLDRDLVLRPGDRIEIPAGTPHWLRFVGRGNAHYLWTCASEKGENAPREDLQAIIE